MDTHDLSPNGYENSDFRSITVSTLNYCEVEEPRQTRPEHMLVYFVLTSSSLHLYNTMEVALPFTRAKQAIVSSVIL